MSLLAALALTAAGSGECQPDPPLTYVCGPARPEDVLALPGTNWLVASGFAPGSGLKLVDGRSGGYKAWYTGTRSQIGPDLKSYPECPGPLDPALFNARGLSLRQVGPGRWRLLAVNHGGRESIEVFDVLASRGNEPTLTWRGCLPMPYGQVGNAVGEFADGTVLVTVLTRPGTTIGDFVQGGITGAVWQWTPGKREMRLLPGTELPGNNGLAVDPDQRRFYVVAFGWHSVVAFDRRDTREPLWKAQAPDFMPDNLHWSGGHLLLTGMRLDEPACGGLRKVIGGAADPMLCHRGWTVGKLDPQNRTIVPVASGGPAPGFNGYSAAAISGQRLWLGSFQSNRLAWLPLPPSLLSRRPR